MCICTEVCEKVEASSPLEYTCFEGFVRCLSIVGHSLIGEIMGTKLIGGIYDSVEMLTIIFSHSFYQKVEFGFCFLCMSWLVQIVCIARQMRVDLV